MALLNLLENTEIKQNPGSLIAITSGQRSPRDWAILATNKIMAVADTAPQPIRDQALVFEQRIMNVIENYIKMAVDEQRSIGK